MPRSFSAVLLLAILAPSLGALLAAPAAHAASSTTIGALPANLASDSKGNLGVVGASAVYANGATFVLGGRFPNGEFSSSVLRIDAATGAVTKFASLPLGTGATDPGRYSGAAVAVGNNVYYFGGAVHVEATIPSSDPSQPPTKAQIPASSADIIKLDTLTGDIQILTDKLPRAAWGLGAAVTNINGAPTVYLFGGYYFQYPSTQDVGRLDQIATFDPASGHVQKSIQTLPYPLQDMGAAAIGTKIYLFGGVGDDRADSNPCPPINETARYSFCQTNNILPIDALGGLAEPDRMRHMPYSAQFVQAAVIVGADRGVRAYVPGGCLSDQSASSSVIVFQPGATSEVSVFPADLPEPSFGAGVATDGSTVSVIGGRRDCTYDGYSNLTAAITKVDPNPGAPYPPNGLQWSPLAPGVHLSWIAPTYDGGSPVSKYAIYRSVPGGNETRIGESQTLVFDDKTARAGGAYIYKVYAVNAIGSSAVGARISVNAESSVPGQVRNLQAYPLNTQALIRWSPPADDGGQPIADYIVYDVTGGGSPVQIGTTDPRTLQFSVKGLTNGNTYAYTVAAHNLKGDSALPKGSSVTPQNVPEAPTGFTANVNLDAGQVTLSWGPGGGLAPDRFIVYRSLAQGDLGVALDSNVAGTTFTDTAESGHTYYYAVKAAHEKLVSPPTEQTAVSLVHPPGAPTGLVAVSQQGSVRLSWVAPADTGDADPSVVHYAVSRGKVGESQHIIATDIEGTTFIDTTASVGVSYAYSVLALNPLAGPSSDSITASAKAIVNQPPVAALSTVPSVANKGDPVQLDASLSYDPDGVIRTYLFDFGDGTQAVHQPTPTVTHAYTTNGSYTATVIVTDDRNDASKTATAHVVIGQPKGTGSAGETPPLTPGASPTATTQRPGSETPKSPIPAPGLGLVAVAAVGAILLARRR